jgi:hypothetical protein
MKVAKETPAQDIDLEDFDPGDLPDEDPLVLRIVDQAVAPFAKMVSPAYLRAMRAALADHLVMHPVTGDLIRSLQERAPKLKSDTEPSAGAMDATETDADSRKKAGSAR